MAKAVGAHLPLSRSLAAMVVAALLVSPPWPGSALARVNPLNTIARQIHKPNMLIVLDTSGSMNGVPGNPFTYASEVGVDCDDGKNCRGWSATAGVCSASGRSCESDADCQTRYCKVGKGQCTSNDDCPTQGTCNRGKYVCRNEADCQPYGEGKCSASGDTCSSTKICPARGNCAETANGCSNPGQACKAGWCQHSKSPKIFCTADKNCGAKGKGSCAYGGTPKGGCLLDNECPNTKSCSTGEACTINADCPKITVGTCKFSKAACTSDANCKAGDVANDSYVDVCQIPTNKCGGNTNYCELDYNKCIYSAGNTCQEVENACKPVKNTCNIPVTNACLSPDLGDVCQKGAEKPGALKMCQLAQSLCNSQSDCPSGDVCGNPTSRTVIAKRTLGRVISQNASVVNLGLMTFYQADYFPYYAVSDPKPITETVFLNTTQLGKSCYDKTSGPATTCTYNGTAYKLASGNNSQYTVNQKKGVKSSHDVAWCGDLCEIPSVGTGMYYGSYYTYTSTGGTVSTTKKTFSSYLGKTTVSAGQAYAYYEARPDYYNGGTLPPIKVPDCTKNACNATCGGRWDENLSPFIKPTATTAQATASSLKVLDWLNKASYGGLVTYGGTPSGCTLENDSTKSEKSSAYHYMEDLRAIDELTCRQNYVLFITDGEANGPGDTGCTEAVCAADDPEKAGCSCKVVLAAHRMRKNLGVRTFVVGFSSDVAGGAARVINDNVAKAGGTDQGNDGAAPFAFVATNEEQLLAAVQNAIYDAVRGSYSTSPATASAGTQVSNGVKSGKYALDSRVDFPSWEGHLLAYDVTVNPPALVWDAREELKMMDWRQRRLYVGTRDGNVVKVQIDDAGRIENRETLHALGLGADPEEAERIVKFTLSAPESGNPAVLGALINSTPIDVGQPGDSPLPGGRAFFLNNKNRPNLTYVGASDGMLHAFFTDDTTIAGNTYPAGSEAFAFLPYSQFEAITRIYVQGGQVPDPHQHIFGLANSPKVKNLCVQNCSDKEQAVWKTLLVMNEGYGGSGLFVLDITNPLGELGFAEPPVMPLWHSHDANLKSSYDAVVGQTISVPGFYLNKTDAMDDHRLVFASGYRVDGSSTTQGRRIISASARSGEILDSQAATAGSSCPQEYTILADIATAKNFGTEEKGRLRAAYVGDTWGSLWRYDAQKLSKVTSFGCDHPLHFAPTVVQLDRDDPSNNEGQAYLVQVTNSTLDDDTFTFPPSQLVIRKEVKDDLGQATADTQFGEGGQLVMTVGAPELCAVTTSGGGCAALMPVTARPTGTPLAILKKDGSGFQMMSMWYAPDGEGCTKGTTWLNLHEIVGEKVSQIQGLKVADEPVTSPVVAGGRILIVSSNGTVDIAADIEASFSAGTASPVAAVGAGIYRLLGWSEVQ